MGGLLDVSGTCTCSSAGCVGDGRGWEGRGRGCLWDGKDEEGIESMQRVMGTEWSLE